MAKWVAVRFSVRVRRVGGSKTGRDALGLTIPKVVCDDLCLKIGDKVKVEIEIPQCKTSVDGYCPLKCADECCLAYEEWIPTN